MNECFHHEDKFSPDEFHVVADPIIGHMIGESYSLLINLPQICFKMACDIVKKRKRYLSRARNRSISNPQTKQGTVDDLSKNNDSDKDDHDDSDKDDHDDSSKDDERPRLK